MVALSAEEAACPEVDGEAGVDDLCAALVAAGHGVTVMRASPIAWRSEDAPAVFRDRLVSLWFSARPEIVHAHALPAGQAVAPVASRLGIPLVQTFEGFARSAVEDADALALRSAARIVATSSAHVFELLKLGVHPGAIKLIPRGVDLQTFRPDAIAPAGRRSAGLRLVTFGTLRPEAGVGDVIAALAQVPGVELAVGELAQLNPSDAERSALEALAEAHRVRDRVAFHGPIPRIARPAFLRAADVAVCAQWNDAAGAFALEAMACGIPVIASAVGSHIDAVADGISGIHVPARSPRQLAYAIDMLRTDDVRRERYARFGLERARARYGWARIAAELVEIYRGLSVVGRPARRPAGIV